MESLDLESVVLAAMLDDGISPGFLHETITNPESPFTPYLRQIGIDPPGARELTQILAIALAKGLVSCRLITDDTDEMLNDIPRELAEREDAIMYELWFELTAAGEEVAEMAMNVISP